MSKIIYTIVNDEIHRNNEKVNDYIKSEVAVGMTIQLGESDKSGFDPNATIIGHNNDFTFC